MLGTQIVADEGHTVAIYRQPTSVDLVSDKGPHRVVHKALLLDKIINDSAFAGTQCAGDTNCYHLF